MTGEVAGETYGSFPDGSARKLVLARGVEHIGVLYSHDSMVEALRWMNAAFDRQQVLRLVTRSRANGQGSLRMTGFFRSPFYAD